MPEGLQPAPPNLAWKLRHGEETDQLRAHNKLKEQTVPDPQIPDSQTRTLATAPQI